MYTGYAYFADGAFKRYVAAAQGGTGGKACEGVGHIYAVCTEEYDIDVDLGVIIGRKERTQCTVYESTGQNLFVVCLAFALGETSGEAACCAILLAILYL